MKRFYKDVAVEPVGRRLSRHARRARDQDREGGCTAGRAEPRAGRSAGGGMGRTRRRARSLPASSSATSPITRSTSPVRPTARRGRTAALRRNRHALLPRRSRRAAPPAPARAVGAGADRARRRATASEFQRVSGIMHRAQPPETLAALKPRSKRRTPSPRRAQHAWPRSPPRWRWRWPRWKAPPTPKPSTPTANAEEDWQAEQWGWEWTAEEKRAKKLAEFKAALEFARLARH